MDQNRFVRISNSEIINLKMVKIFDLSFTGRIWVVLLNGNISYVSRPYVTKIKHILGIGGKGRYLFYAPILIERVGSEIGAMILQTILSGLIGGICCYFCYLGNSSVESSKANTNLFLDQCCRNVSNCVCSRLD